MAKAKKKQPARSARKTGVVKSFNTKTPLSKNLLILFVIIFAVVGGIKIWQTFAANDIAYTSQNLDTTQSVNYSIVTESRASKRNSQVVQITNTTANTAKATYVKSVAAGNYKVCFNGVAQAGSPSGTFSARNTSLASLGSTNFVSTNTDYKEITCLQISHGGGNLSLVISDTAAQSSLRVSSIILYAGSGSISTLPAGYSKLAWSEEFNGTSLDTTHWNYDGTRFNYGAAGGQHLDNVSLSRNVSVGNGTLNIKAVKEDYPAGDGTTAHWTAGSVQTKNGFDFKPGERLETRFKGSQMGGMRPAMWSSSPTDDGELDFPEMFANQKGATLNGIKDYSPFTQYNKQVPIDNNWHVYAVEWDLSNDVRFYIDGVLKHTVPASFGVPKSTELIRATFQVGGTYGRPIDPAASLEFQNTDWIRVYSN